MWQKAGLAGLVGVGAILLTAAGCDVNESAQQEREARQAGYDQLIANQPAETMGYSPTRETINGWVNTWDEPGKLAYVYLQNANGEYGYFITVGPPVSYCAQNAPMHEWDRPHSQAERYLVEAPSLDGAYYSGAQCNAYYAFDANTGAYVEFTIGANQSFFLYDQPMELPQFEAADPLGPTTLDNVEED